MPIAINGSGTVTGVSVGGLPDGIVDTDMIAANAVNDVKIADLYSSDAINIGGLRIVKGTVTTPSSTSDASSSYGVSAQKYQVITITYSGFASAPCVSAAVDTDYHETKVSPIYQVGTTSAKIYVTCSRSAGITSKTLSYTVIGEAS